MAEIIIIPRVVMIRTMGNAQCFNAQIIRKIDFVHFIKNTIAWRYYANEKNIYVHRVYGALVPFSIPGM